MRLAVSAVVGAFLVSTVSFAQSNWDKNYTVGSKPNLQVEVDGFPSAGSPSKDLAEKVWREAGAFTAQSFSFASPIIA